jgi:hypothetical protein
MFKMTTAADIGRRGPLGSLGMLTTWNSWTIRTHQEHRADKFREIHRQNGDFPPESIAKLGCELGQTHTVEEQSSSLVFTGDFSGHLWICSVWSSVTDSASVSRVIGKVLPRILERFIHQQASGRCLVFLLLLGHLCEKLAAEYGKVLARLDDIMEIGVSLHSESLMVHIDGRIRIAPFSKVWKIGGVPVRQSTS